MESNHRAQIRSLPLYPLSYGAGLTLSMPDVLPGPPPAAQRFATWKTS